jgi:GNAT superfamily N-acetyltransferase
VFLFLPWGVFQVDKSQVIELYDLDQRINVKYPDTRREEIPNIVRHIGLGKAGSGTILYSRLDNGNVDQTICGQIDYFESIGQDFEWKVFDYDSPSDLKDRLAAYGFEVEEVETIMVFDLNATPDFLLQPVTRDVRQITTTAKIADVMSVERQVWNEDFADLEAYLTNTLANEPDKMSIYTAYVDEQPVSSAWIYFPPHSQFASLWGGSTLAEFRGQGLYSALLAVRIQEAISRKVSYLTVDASPMSRPILEKFGFEKIANSYPCNWKCRSEK